MVQFLIDTIILTIVCAIVSYCMARNPAPPDLLGLGQHGAAKPGLPVRQLVITTADQRSIRIAAQTAATIAEQQSPLIFCSGFPDGAGMLFVFPQAIPIDAWMKNCTVPIDVLFIRPDHTISEITSDRPDSPESPSSQGVDTAAILELNAGASATLEIKVGDKISY